MLEVYTKIVGQPNVKCLSTLTLTITPAEADQLRQPENGIYFDWGPDARRYQSYIDRLPKRDAPDPLLLLKALHDSADAVPVNAESDEVAGKGGSVQE